MFLNKTISKRFMKEAYNNNGLTVGNISEGIIASGSYWKIWTPVYNMPNWYKACLIELIGEIPGEGTVLEYRKNEAPQYVISENPALDIHALYMKADQPYIVTPVSYKRGYLEYQFLQKKDSLEVADVPKGLFNIIDFSNMESDESYPSGPSTDKYADLFYWANERCVLELVRARISDKDMTRVMDALTAIDFCKEGA